MMLPASVLGITRGINQDRTQDAPAKLLVIGQEKQIGEKSGFIFLDFPNEIHPMPVKTPNLRKIEKFKKRSEKMVLRHCCCRVAFLRGPLIRFLRFF